jgi:23S rRNA (pseudouridine1915-N3)-methyltransferase
MIRAIRIYAVGKLKEHYIREAVDEYVKRLRPFCKVEIVEIKDMGKEKESARLMEFVTNDTYLLDALGQEMSSEEFSEKLKKSDGTISFIIGGPDGITDDVKSRAKRISLSRMTFPHDIARFVLVEQIYRGFMIINNRPYHR